MNTLREKPYNYVMHFILSAKHPKYYITSNKNNTQVEILTLPKLIDSKREVLGFSEIIQNHQLDNFNRIYSFDFDSCYEVFMFCKNEFEKSEYFNILVLIKNNPNLNLVIDKVVKKLREITKFKKITFSLSENDLATTYYIEIIDGKFEFKKDKYCRAKIENLKKFEFSNRIKLFLNLVFLILLIVIYWLCNEYNSKSILLAILILFVSSAISFFYQTILDSISGLLKKEKYNNHYFVLYTNYNFESDLEHRVKYDPNMASSELQPPTEE